MVRRSAGLFMAAAFLYATVYFQYPNSCVTDLDDYFFVTDVDEKAHKVVSQNPDLYLGPSENFTPQFDVSRIEFQSARLPELSPAVLEQSCRSPPQVPAV